MPHCPLTHLAASDVRYADSWLTVGETSGSSIVSSAGIEFSNWDTNKGLYVESGTVFW
jgi:hypothetical protein